MRKKIIYFSLALFFCAFVVFFSNAKFRNLKNRYSKIEEGYKLQKDSLNKIIEILMTNNRINVLKIDNCIIHNISSGEEKKLYDILDKSITTIIRLINTGCDPCNKELIEMIKKIIDHDNLVIMVNTANMKLLRLHLDEISITTTVYWLKETSILFKEDDNTKVLVSRVDKEGKILRVYHIEQELLYIVKSLVY